MLDRAHHVIPERTQVAAVVELEELGAEGGHIDLDRALAGAGLARQTAIEGFLDLVREIALAAALGPGVADAGGQCAPSCTAARAPAFLDRIKAQRRKLAQPLPHQLRPALGRVAPLPHSLPGRAHGVVRIPIVAGAVAVAVEGIIVALPNVNG